MTIPTFRHEEFVKVGDDALRLVLDFGALDAVESGTGRAFDGILRELTTPGTVPPASLVSRVVWGLLRRHHPEVDLDQAASLAIGPAAPAIGVAMGTLFETAFPRADPGRSDAGGKDRPAHPRKPRGASRNTSSPGAASA